MGNVTTPTEPLVPAEPTEPTAPAKRSGIADRARSLVSRGGRGLGLALLVLVASLPFRGMPQEGGYLSFDPCLLFALGLLGAGALLLRGQETAEGEGRAERARKPRSPLGALTLAA